MIRQLIIALFLVLAPAFAQEPPRLTRDIWPKKGQVTKNIHVVFDKSGSMGIDDFKLAYAEIQAIAMQDVDDFNLTLSVFGNGSVRISPKWYKMPSLKAFKKIMAFAQNTEVDPCGTYILPVFQQIYKEKHKKLSVIIITDGAINDWEKVAALIAKNKKYKFTMGVIDTDGPDGWGDETDFYAYIKKHKHWWIDLVKEEDEDE